MLVTQHLRIRIVGWATVIVCGRNLNAAGQFAYRWDHWVGEAASEVSAFDGLWT